MEQDSLELLVEGGKAKPGPASAQKLAMYKINMGNLFQEINEKTKDYSGMNVPVKVIIDKKTSKYSIKIGTPPVSSLIRKELGLKKIAPKKEGEEKAEEKGGKKGRKPKAKEEEAEETDEEKEKKVKKEKKKSKKAERVIVGNLNIDQCIRIAKMKRDDLLAKNMKGAVKEVVATVVSMPLTVEGKSPKEVLKEIDEGKYDDKIEKTTT